MKRILGFHMTFVVLAILATSFMELGAAPKNTFTRRYVWLGFDHIGRQSHNKGIKPIIKRAADAGYNGVMLRAWYNKIKTKPVIDSLASIVAYAKARGMDITPTALYQGEISELNATHAEAFPVKGTRFAASGRSAKVVSDHTVSIQNGDFEKYSGNNPTGWTPKGPLPGTNLFIDTKVKHSGNASLRVTNPGTYMSRLEQRVTGLKPNRAYELTIWLKTDGYSNAYQLGFFVQSGARALLCRRDVGLSDWGCPVDQKTFRKFTIDFNSLENTSTTVSILFAQWRSTGTVWVDDVAIREVGLYETIRRPSCPVVVRSEDGVVTYEEGKDYKIKPGPIVCMSGQGGQELTIPAGSRIQSGQVLQVDWYQHANVETLRASTSFCSDAVWTTQRKNIQYIDKLIGNPKGFYAFIDEWRDAGWDPGCSRFRNAGEYMGWVAGETDKQLRAVNCDRDVYICNDMYDPYHNSHDPHGMCRIGTANSWKGLPENVIVLNWRPSMGSKKTVGNPIYNSLKFFGGLDPKYRKERNRQVISPNFASQGEAQVWENCLAQAEKEGLTGVVGVAYVTWYNDYRILETCVDVFRKSGRWAKGPIPFGDEKQECTKISSITPEKATDAKAITMKSAFLSPKIDFVLHCNARVTLQLVNALGQSVYTRRMGDLHAGSHSFDAKGQGIPNGVYFAKLDIDEHGDQVQRVGKVAIF